MNSNTEIIILGILIDKEKSNISEIQNILTSYGCIIKTRLGLHTAASESSAEKRLILLELENNITEFQNLEKALKEQAGVRVERMIF